MTPSPVLLTTVLASPAFGKKSEIGGTMHRFVWLASAAVASLGFCNACHGQTSIAATSIASFEDVAGEWVGHANEHNVSLEIDTTGRFTARYALGGESGEARLEGGALVIPLGEHQGSLQLAWDGATLKGPGLIAGKTWRVSLVRTAPAAKSD
jgi:hypothetical protein